MGAYQCNLKLRDDIDQCQKDADGWQCLKDRGVTGVKIPVIQTRIKCSDWRTFYPDCSLPTDCKEAPGVDAGS